MPFTEAEMIEGRSLERKPKLKARFAPCPLCGSDPVEFNNGRFVACSARGRCILREDYQDDTNCHVTADEWPMAEPVDYPKILRAAMRNVFEGEGSPLYGGRDDYADLSDAEYAALTKMAGEVNPHGDYSEGGRYGGGET